MDPPSPHHLCKYFFFIDPLCDVSLSATLYSRSGLIFNIHEFSAKNSHNINCVTCGVGRLNGKHDNVHSSTVIYKSWTSNNPEHEEESKTWSKDKRPLRVGPNNLEPPHLSFAVSYTVVSTSAGTGILKAIFKKGTVLNITDVWYNHTRPHTCILAE